MIKETKTSKIDTIQIAWQQFVLGDNDGLVKVFETYYTSLLFTAYYYLKNDEQSKDIVQDVFTKLLSFSKQQRYRNLSNVNEKLEIFLKVLTKNRCLDYLKVENNRRNILNGIYSVLTRSFNTNDIFNDDFKLLLDTLPQRQKQVLDLHLQGYDNNEISSQLGISYNTVRNTLSSSKSKIKHLYRALM